MSFLLKRVCHVFIFFCNLLHICNEVAIKSIENILHLNASVHSLLARVVLNEECLTY